MHVLIHVSIKVNAPHEMPMQAQRGGGGIAPTHSQPWSMGGQHHTPVALPLGNTRCPLYRSLAAPRGRSGRHGKSRPTGIRPPDRPARGELLYRLSYHGRHSFMQWPNIFSVTLWRNNVGGFQVQHSSHKSKPNEHNYSTCVFWIGTKVYMKSVIIFGLGYVR